MHPFVTVAHGNTFHIDVHTKELLPVIKKNE